ncbi:MAG TPA: metallophosphoesterase family protein [Ktedonobacteraceae bacterium]|nr:metallophosphoesterase family protein [Ktedonobacteraceae bacterium]
MRYAIFTDIHANLEALEAVLAKIDELAQEEPIDQIWFLGDLVGYGPNPNECIVKLRERTDVIIAGNHDWAAVGKIDLDEFSEAARISAQWTAERLTEEHRTFLANLPERIEIEECLLVHGSPYGPLWEYLTSEVLAERSFQCFTNRYCLVGHTHVPVIFQQPDEVANAPTAPLTDTEENMIVSSQDDETVYANGVHDECEDSAAMDDEETTKVAAVHPTAQSTKSATHTESARSSTDALQDTIADTADVIAELQQHREDDAHGVEPASPQEIEEIVAAEEVATSEDKDEAEQDQDEAVTSEAEAPSAATDEAEANEQSVQTTTGPAETQIVNAEERLNQEIEELLALLGLSQSMIRVTNEMVIPPEDTWHAPDGYRAIINPGGVGQPRDGDARAAFMVYDTEEDSFTFYRIPYAIKKTQEKIIKAGLPVYLAKRLEFGR